MSGKKKKSHQAQSAHNLYIFGELLLCFVFVFSVHSGFTVFSLCVCVCIWFYQEKTYRLQTEVGAKYVFLFPLNPKSTFVLESGPGLLRLRDLISKQFGQQCI